MKKNLLLIVIIFSLSVIGYSYGASSGDDKVVNKSYNYDKGASLIKKGKKLEKKGKIKKAKQRFNKALEHLIIANDKNPDKPDILNYLGFAFSNTGDFIMAEVYYSQGLEIDPNHIGLMCFSVGGKAALYASVKRFRKMWGTPGLEFAAYVPFYPACNITFDHYEKISDRPIRIFYGELDEWSSPIPCEKYVNRLRKVGKDITITIYPDAHHNFDAKGDANAPRSIPGDSRINCRFVEKAEYNLVVLEKDKDNKELETLYSQCISLYPNRKQVCRLNAYSSLKTSNIYSQETRDYFTSTINMKEKMCNMADEDTTAQEEIATKETKEEDIITIRSFLEEYIPDGNGKILDSKVCIYTDTPDFDFILDFSPVDENIINTLEKNFEDFNRAYDENGMKIDEFESFGASVYTMNNFLEGYEEFINLIRNRMIG